ncbi:4-hydroxyacetophenone monooxygenase [Gorgonomyces haynaldii]|nr:4-hydroxyacetophenone monooxygenase [Gorgonomyces haynaldii]
MKTFPTNFESAMPKIIIIGAGLSSIALACNLKKRGFTDFVIYDKANDMGGTWLWNTYPGAACDVPATMYSFSFAPKYDWTGSWVGQPELLEYIWSVVDKFQLRQHFVPNTECLSAKWDNGEWIVEFESNGKQIIEKCQILVCCPGALSTPNDCPLPGKDKFKGAIFHSARWNHDVDLNQKQVIVIGNGCSAAQIVPSIADKVKSITQFARSAHNLCQLPISPVKRSKITVFLLKYVPGLNTVFRFILFLVMDQFFAIFKFKSGQTYRRILDNASKSYIKRTAPKEYLDLLMPQHEFGYKRRIFDMGYLESLKLPHVHLTNEALQEIVEDGVKTKDGKVYQADVIVYSTGFKVQEYMTPMQVYGVKSNLHEQWKSTGARAYLGTFVHGFPNFCLLSGPNTGTGHHSVLFFSECQINLLLQALKPVLSGKFKTFQVTQEAEDAYNKEIEKRMQKLIWSQTDKKTETWYLDNGRNSVIYPGYASTFWFKTLYLKRRHFVFA